MQTEEQQAKAYIDMIRSKNTVLDDRVMKILEQRPYTKPVLEQLKKSERIITQGNGPLKTISFGQQGIGYIFGQLNSQKSGFGHLFIKNGTIYSGQFLKGELKEGIKLHNNTTYQGGFKNLIKHGQGLEYNEYSYYAGQFAEDSRNGKGVEIKGDQMFQGSWRNGLKHGKFQVTTNGNKHTKYYYNDVEVDKHQAQEPPIIQYYQVINGYQITQKHLKNIAQGKKLSPHILKAYCWLLSNEYWRLATFSSKPCKRVKMLTEIVQVMVGQRFTGSALEQFETPINSPDRLNESSKPLPIFEYFNFLMMPIQILNSHFALITVEINKDIKNQKSQFSGIDFYIEIRYYDSMRYEIDKEIKETIIKYLRYQSQKYLPHMAGQQNKEDNVYVNFSKALQKASYYGPIQMKLPEQPNEIDCGVWVAIFSRQILYDLLEQKGKQWNKKDNVERTRQKMVNEIKYECAKIR